jgi:hypothetical protein
VGLDTASEGTASLKGYACEEPCTLEIDADDADPFGNGPVLMDGEVVGRGTAGGFGHYVQMSLMLGHVKTEFAEVGRAREVRVLDQRRPARIIAESPYAPDNAALRAWKPAFPRSTKALAIAAEGVATISSWAYILPRSRPRDASQSGRHGG